MRIWRALLLLLLLPVPALADGLSADGLARLTAALRGDVEAGRYPGAVVLIEKDGAVVYREAVGELAPGGPPMRPDAIFRIASMTKPITSVAALMLVEDGKLALDDPLHKSLPAFAAPQVLLSTGGTRPAARPITIRDLMRHTAGMIYGVFAPGSSLGQSYMRAGITDADRPLAAWTEALAGLPLAADPGTEWQYGRATDVLGRVVEVAGGDTLDKVMAARIFGPLGMADTGFVLNEAQAARMTQMAPPRDRFDPTRAPVLLSGGGGLLSTADDYLVFCRMLLAGGGALLRPATVAAMTRDQLDGIHFPIPGNGFGLGVAVRTDARTRRPGSVGNYGWSGYYGSTFWVDPARRLIVIAMMQNPDYRRDFWRQLRTLVYAALPD